MATLTSARRSVCLRVEALEGRCLPSASEWISSLYANLLHRAAQPAEVAGWQGALQAGASPAQVALAFTTGTEYRADLIQADYQNLLGRPPAAAEEANWLGALQGGVGEERLTAEILASPEYRQANGPTDGAWLIGVYRAELGRPPDPAGLASWFMDLEAPGPLLNHALPGGMSAGPGSPRPYAAVAFAIGDSAEAHARAVTAVFEELLGRAPDPQGLAGWTAALNQGLTPAQLRAFVVSSEEYMQLVGAGTANPGTPPSPVGGPTSDPTTDPGTGPGVGDPGIGDPGTTDPGNTDPGYTDPGTTDPGYTDPGTTDPGTTDPGYTDPGYTEPGITDPGFTDPGLTDPGFVDPGTIDPGYVDPWSSC